MRTSFFLCLLIFVVNGFAMSFDISGIIKDSTTKEPLTGAIVKLKSSVVSDTTGSDGAFHITGTLESPVITLQTQKAVSDLKIVEGNRLKFNNVQFQRVQVAVANLLGKKVCTLYDGTMGAGTFLFSAPVVPAGYYLYMLEAESGQITVPFIQSTVSSVSVRNVISSGMSLGKKASDNEAYGHVAKALNKESAFVDTIEVVVSGYNVKKLAVSDSLIQNLEILCVKSDSTSGTIPTLYISTVNGDSVTSDTAYVSCSLKIDGKNLYADYAASDVQIRQRGNSSRINYDKKPYRIKLGTKAALLGMKADKDWVLLANYRDPTCFMNAVTFDMARYMELPYTNSNQFVEVYLNNEYIGMYQITEQIEQGANRVAIDEATGVLLSLDLDDGPELAPAAGDNFTSTVYELPVCVKNPKAQTAAQLDSIKADFAVLENLIKAGVYSDVAKRLDIASLIDFLIIQELTRNVELVSPRSMYLYKTSDNIYHFGPVWDFDGGFAFDWASMTTGHNYFGSQTWVMGSTNPATHPMTAYDYIPGFFVDLFANSAFVSAYKARWNKLKPGLLNYTFAKLDDYSTRCSTAITKNAARWPIDKDATTEIQRMKEWLTARVAAYSSVVESY